MKKKKTSKTTINEYSNISIKVEQEQECNEFRNKQQDSASDCD